MPLALRVGLSAMNDHLQQCLVADSLAFSDHSRSSNGSFVLHGGTA